MKFFATAAVALGAAFSAQADTATFNDSFGPSVTNWTRNIGVSQFNMGGTLNSVTFVLTGNIDQRIRAENTGDIADVLTPVSGANFLFRKATTALQTLTVSNIGTSFSATAFDGVSNFGGTSGVDFGLSNANGSLSFTFTGASLADFIGTGTLGSAGYNVRAVGNGRISSENGNLDSSISTLADYNLAVTYDYTAAVVPEPASLAMLLAGLGVLGFVGRRRAG